MNDRSMPHPGMLCHAVHFYRDLDGLADTVSRFLVDGIAVGQPGVVVARPEVRQRVEEKLRGVGIDVDAAVAERRVLMVDAATSLEAVLVDGLPDPERAGQLLQSWCDHMDAGPSGGTIRFYGEMADILWQSGRRLAALELEDLGNMSSSPGGCIVLCGYAVTGRHERSTDEDICAFHSHVMSTTGELTAIRA